jgi:hypothetical protein
MMELSKFSRCLCICFLAAAALAGCGNSSSQPGISPQSGTQSISLPFAVPYDGAAMLGTAARLQSEADSSWMASEAATDDLLYVSNLQNVTVYSYPGGKHVGTLKGFYRPYGECVDSAGDVFIANEDTVVEYKHGGKKPVETLTFSGYGSGGCASDPTTGNLAVTWDAGFSSGYVAVYQHGSGTPTLYDNGTMLFTFCGYDHKGNLFVDGVTQHGEQFQFAELPKNGESMTTISLDQSVEFGGNVQWDGRYISISDAEAYKIYRFTITGSSGTLKGTTDLGNATSLYQTWIDGKRIAGADILDNAIWYWNYPAGGAAIKSFTKGVFRPYGVTISKAQK